MVAIIVVLLSFWLKKKRRKDVRSLWSQYPGRNPNTPINIERFNEMDSFVRRQRCFCGGVPQVVSEGSKTMGNDNLRVIRADCPECEEELYFFFKMKQMLH